MSLADALKNLTEAEAHDVENGQCNDMVEDPYEDEHLKPAETVLERLNAAFAKLAEMPSAPPPAEPQKRKKRSRKRKAA